MAKILIGINPFIAHKTFDFGHKSSKTEVNMPDNALISLFVSGCAFLVLGMAHVRNPGFVVVGRG